MSQEQTGPGRGLLFIWAYLIALLLGCMLGLGTPPPEARVTRAGLVIEPTTHSTIQAWTGGMVSWSGLADDVNFTQEALPPRMAMTLGSRVQVTDPTWVGDLRWDGGTTTFYWFRWGGRGDFDCDGDVGTDADIAEFFRCLADRCGGADFDDDGDAATDADIQAFFAWLGGG